MLPSSPHVRKVYSESSGIVSTLRLLDKEEARSTLCIDSTTLDVQVGRATAVETREACAEMVDAPVSGGTRVLCPVRQMIFTRVGSRRYGSEGWYVNVPCRWDGGRIRARVSDPRSHGQTDHSLWALRSRAGSQDLQQPCPRSRASGGSGGDAARTTAGPRPCGACRGDQQLDGGLLVVVGEQPCARCFAGEVTAMRARLRGRVCDGTDAEGTFAAVLLLI